MISFPNEVYQPTASEDFNPSIRMFGRRFSDDQQVMDLVAEFLLVAGSMKKVHYDFNDVFPPRDILIKWRTETACLRYYPKQHLNLKLFALLSSSRIETRHVTHREHATELLARLANKISLESEDEKRVVLQTLNNLILGFWGNGAQRTWCAQTFYPFCRAMLCGEVLWGETSAKKIKPQTWAEVLEKFSELFDYNKHRFLARGGEALYLHLCNVFTMTKEEIEAWCESSGLDCFTADEMDPKKLREDLEKGVERFFDRTPPMLSKVLDFIDTGVDTETSECSDFVRRPGCEEKEPRSVACGWIPLESWHEGFLFAVELKRLFALNLGVMETVELLKIACAMQVMRALAAQTYRNSDTPANGRSDGFDYRALICDSSNRARRAKDFSWKSLSEISREIQQVIRKPDVVEEIRRVCATKKNVGSDVEKAYRDADKYGFKLYRKIGKSIGLVVPPTGKKLRYTLNDKILRYFVVTLIPGARMTLESFKRQIEIHHGFVFDLDRLAQSRNWCNRTAELQGGGSSNEFLEHMLEASGVLVRLSDSCSLVKNPYVSDVK